MIKSFLSSKSGTYVKFGASAFLLAVLAVGSVSRVPVNTVGVKSSILSGVSENTLSTGVYLHLPYVENVYNIPTKVQTSKISGVYIQTNTEVNYHLVADLKYKVEPEKAMNLFKDYQNMENVHNEVVAPLVQRVVETASTKYNIYEILGAKRNTLYEETDKLLKEALKVHGLEFVSFTFIDTDAGPDIENAISINSSKLADKEAEVLLAVQDQERIKAEGESTRLKAEADAQASLIKAEAQAKANQIVSSSLTEEIIRMREADARMKHGWYKVVGTEGVQVQVKDDE